MDISEKKFAFAIKRNGNKAPYNSQKIVYAVQKAFVSSQEPINIDTIAQLVQEVEQCLLTQYNTAPSIHIEHIQDQIEHILMKNQYFMTAKKFIIYRQKHAEKRLFQTIKQQNKIHTISVQKRDNTNVSFNLNKILLTLRNISQDIDTHKVPLDPIVLELEKNIYEGISSHEVEEALVLSTISFAERDPAYSIIASRLLRQKLYKEVFVNKLHTSNGKNYTHAFEQRYKEMFIKNIKKGVELNYFTEDLLQFDLDALAETINIPLDDNLTYLGIRTLYERYFVKHEEGKSLETPQAFWMRVAMGVSIHEKDKTEYAKKFYALMSELRYIPSTPTLFHSGLVRPQLSSCYISTIADDLANIFKCIGDNAQMAKWSGGIGNDWTSVRATNAHIKSTNVESQGIIPFLKIANDTTLAINRSGKRRGATCAYLETWHLDIEDFIDLRKNTGDDRRRTHDMNTANWIPDLFMKRVEEGGEWTLFSPDEVSDLHECYGSKFEKRYIEYEQLAKENKITHYKIVDAVKLWRKMLTRLFETGHPWMTFKDPCNVRSPQDHVGVIHSSNLCTEITLNNSSEETAVCNLGSINLKNHVTVDGLNQYMLIDTIKTAMRMLDNVIDINFYPTPESRTSNIKHRPVGLGVMGLQDALYKLSLSFTSQETITFVDNTFEFIAYHAILASSEIAKEKEPYSTFKGSKWDRGLLPFDTISLLEQERGQPVEVNKNTTMDWDIVKKHIAQHGIRNSNTMAIAPTATISNIAGCYPCTEPIYNNMYVKSNMNGEFTVINEYLVYDLKQLGLWNKKMLEKIKYYDGNISYIDEIPDSLKEIYKTTFEIDSITLLKLTAVRAKWIDQSQSHNVFIKGVSGKKLHDTYMRAWKMGLKTTYYLRSLGASQIEKSTLDAKEYGYTQKRVYTPHQESPPPATHDAPAPHHEQEAHTIMHPSLSHATKEPVFADSTHSPQHSQQLLLSDTDVHRHHAHTHTTATMTQEKADTDEFLPSTSTTPTIMDTCNILDPDCESCQ